MPDDSAESKRATGKRIAQARRDAGLTQKQLARLAGVEERSVQAWEQGQTNPYRRINLLEKILGRSRNWILHGSDVLTVERDLFNWNDLLESEFRDQLEGTRREEGGRPREQGLIDVLIRLNDRLVSVEARLDAIENTLGSPSASSR